MYKNDTKAYTLDGTQTEKLIDQDEDVQYEIEDDIYKRSGPCESLAYILKQILIWFDQDWVFLLLLGVIMALLSFIVDISVAFFINARSWFLNDFSSQTWEQYLMWVLFAVSIVLFSAGFVHVVAPHSAGSGIPEVRTILRGVVLKEYLTFKTLVAKVIGLIATLGSGMPLGKEGPFVHIASIVAHLLSKLFTSFKKMYENESKKADVLVAAAAVGIGACFAAPVGGVFFSIEVTTTYFAIRNYWRGFFAAVCGATAYRLLAVWFQDVNTVQALFRTNFVPDFPFGPQELFAFAIMGVVCGLAGALFVWMLTNYILFIKSNNIMKRMAQANRFIYPTVISFIIATLLFPHGSGKFMAGEYFFHQQLSDLFSNFTWTKENFTITEAEVISRWTTPYGNVFVNLVCYFIFNFVFSIIASTLPIPSGMFIPVMKIGSSLGRIIGEIMHLSFPFGVMYGGTVSPIISGGYAVVGTAAFTAAVTQTVSVSVIIFEMTGQITHVVPIMLAVLIAKAVASALQPSMYDSLILLKKLPYLPDLLPSNSRMYEIYVEDFMVRDVKYIWHGISFQELSDILRENKQLKSLPLVDSPQSMILLGSVLRGKLVRMIERHVARERRIKIAEMLQREPESRKPTTDLHQENIQNQSRFEIAPVSNIEILQKYANDAMLPLQTKKRLTELDKEYGAHPKKSILKKTSSISTNSPYSTVTVPEQKLRTAIESIFKKSNTMQDVRPDLETGIIKSNNIRISNSATLTSGMPKKVQLPRTQMEDIFLEYRKTWEVEGLSKLVDWNTADIRIDPAPFQLVERTSLLKVHSLFSMLGMHHAYVTKIGRLIGVVSLIELRQIIEDINSNNIALTNTCKEI